MTFDEAVKIYTRFLKEHGVFKRALEIHMQGASNDKNMLFLDSLKRTICWSRWIQDEVSFCLWRYTKESDSFWWALSLLWNIECLLKGISGDGIEFSEKYKMERKEQCLKDIVRYNTWVNNTIRPSCIDKERLDELKQELHKLKEKLEKMK